MALRFTRRRGADAAEVAVLGTYTFPSRTVRVLQTQDERIQWTCDCEKFRRQGGQKEPLWCKHIAKAAARRSIERLTRRVAVQRGVERPSGRQLSFDSMDARIQRRFIYYRAQSKQQDEGLALAFVLNHVRAHP